jgi:putative Mg2+ transporter-C (MgtC) family protein
MDLLEIHWPTILSHLALMGVAYVLAIPIGWNRERYERSAGLRTFPLVAVATCGFMLVGIEALTSTSAQGRVLEGIITGMGFIGGGAILKSGRVVTGTATAASLWGTGAVGIAVAWQRFEIAIVLSVLTFLTLQFVPTLKPMVREERPEDEDEEPDPDEDEEG